MQKDGYGKKKEKEEVMKTEQMAETKKSIRNETTKARQTKKAKSQKKTKKKLHQQQHHRHVRLPVILDAADKRRVPHTAAGIAETGNGPVVGEALELVLHSLRQGLALDEGVERCLIGEDGVKVVGIACIGL